MRFTLTVVVVVAVLAGPEVSADVYVQNYSWLQLPDGDAAPLLGNSNGVSTGGTGYGTPGNFRWGHFVWIPNGSLTQTTLNEGDDSNYYSNGMYWAAIKLDQPREITKVGVQWWAAEGTSITKYYIDGSNNGEDWTELTSYEYVKLNEDEEWERVAMTGNRFGLYGDNALAIPTDNVGTYQYIRVRFMENDYTYGNAARGGPGMYVIEPIGNGMLAEEKVNWAHQQFGTAITSEGLHWKNGRLNNGYLYDDEGNRTGDGNWAGTPEAKPWEGPDMYIGIDLGAARTIHELVSVWDAEYSAGSFRLEYSTDDDTYFAVKAAEFSSVNGGMLSVTFDPVTARYWRISEVLSTSANEPNRLVLFNQIMMYGPAIPEPATMSLLALGGLALLRRRAV